MPYFEVNEYWRVTLKSGDKTIGISDYGTEEEARRLLSGLDGFSFTIIALLEHWTKVSSESLEVVGKRETTTK